MIRRAQCEQQWEGGAVTRSCARRRRARGVPRRLRRRRHARARRRQERSGAAADPDHGHDDAHPGETRSTEAGAMGQAHCGRCVRSRGGRARAERRGTARRRRPPDHDMADGALLELLQVRRRACAGHGAASARRACPRDSPAPGSTAEIQLGDSPQGPFRAVTTARPLTARTSFWVPRRTGRYIVVWITGMPQDSAAEVSEVRVRAHLRPVTTIGGWSR